MNNSAPINNSAPLTLMESYFTSSPGKFFDNAGKWIGNISNCLAVAECTARLGEEISSYQNNTLTTKKWNSVADSFGTANGTLSLTKVVFSIINLITGKMFWKCNKDGTWMRISNPSQNAENDGPGPKVRRDFIEILQDIISLAGRILSPIRWLDSKSLYDLGKHGGRMKHATTALSGSYIALDILRLGMEIANDIDEHEGDSSSITRRIGGRVVDLVCGTLDLATFTLDAGFFTSTPALRFVGIGLNFLSRSTNLIKKIASYEI